MFSSLFITLLCTILLILPDYFFRFANQAYGNDFTIKNLAIYLVLFILMFVVGRLPRLWMRYLAVMVLCTISFAEFYHFSYYGSLIHHNELPLFFSEWKEISETMGSIWRIGLWPAICAYLPCVLILLLLRKHGNERAGSRWALVVLVLLLSILPVKALFASHDKRFEPAAKYHSLRNGLFTFSYFGGNMLWKKGSGNTKAFLPYQVRQIHQMSGERKNIVIIMGESLSYSRMGLYGHFRETTPRLGKLKGDDNFVYKKGFAASSATTVTIPMFFNLVREPGNFKPFSSQSSNLFKFAKEQGYTTYFYGHQDVKDSINDFVQRTNIDHFKNELDYGVGQGELSYDQVLLDDLQQIDFSTNNFIVLNQRAAHSPYEKNYPKEYEKFSYDPNLFAQYMKNSYDNSVLYCDYVISEAIRLIKEKTEEESESLFFFTSDHGELLGEDGQFGHTLLNIKVGRVPFIYYGINSSLTAKVEQLEEGVSHHEIGLLIAEALGYEVINPNDDGETIYLNGNSLSGDLGFVTISRKELEENL